MRKDYEYDKPNYIYFLLDPGSGKVKYIGITNSPDIRYVAHLKNQYIDKDSERYKWMDKLVKEENPPTMLLVANFDDREQCELTEKYLIWEFSRIDNGLFNTTHTYRIHMPKFGIKRLSKLAS